jgi:hypothetical protein
MKTQFKALVIALAFSPVVAFADNFEVDDFSLQLYNDEVTVENVDTIEMVNTEIKQAPTAAGAKMAEGEKEKQLWDVLLPY